MRANVVGVTATRYGLTMAQISKTRKWLSVIKQHTSGPIWLHHGCCVGGDTGVHRIAKQLGGFLIYGHPPIDRSKISEWVEKDCDRLAEPLDFLVRTRVIVVVTEILFALPRLMQEEARSGTWSGIREARRGGRDIIIIWPNGTVTKEGRISETNKAKIF